MNNVIYRIIKRPLLSEKSNKLQESLGTVVFDVAVSANKLQIKESIEHLFKVQVAKVTTVHVVGKQKRRLRGMGKTADRKKAYVTLAEGKIDFFENL